MESYEQYQNLELIIRTLITAWSIFFYNKDSKWTMSTFKDYNIVNTHKDKNNF